MTDFYDLAEGTSLGVTKFCNLVEGTSLNEHRRATAAVSPPSHTHRHARCASFPKRRALAVVPSLCLISAVPVTKRQAQGTKKLWTLRIWNCYSNSNSYKPIGHKNLCCGLKWGRVDSRNRQATISGLTTLRWVVVFFCETKLHQGARGPRV